MRRLIARSFRASIASSSALLTEASDCFCSSACITNLCGEAPAKAAMVGYESNGHYRKSRSARDFSRPESMAALKLSPEIEEVHRAACARGQDHYVDPETGFLVFTALSHTKVHRLRMSLASTLVLWFLISAAFAAGADADTAPSATLRCPPRIQLEDSPLRCNCCHFPNILLLVPSRTNLPIFFGRFLAESAFSSV